MFRDSVVVRTRPRAIPLAMITIRKILHGFPFFSMMSMGLRLAALGAAGAPIKTKQAKKKILQVTNSSQEPMTARL